MGGVGRSGTMSKIGISPPGTKTYAPYTPAVVVGQLNQLLTNDVKTSIKSTDS